MIVKAYKNETLNGSFYQKNEKNFSIKISAEEGYLCIKDGDRFLITLNGLELSFSKEDFVKLFYIYNRKERFISNGDYTVIRPSILFAEREKVVPVYDGDEIFPYFCAKDDYIGDNISMYKGKRLERIPIDLLVKSEELCSCVDNSQTKIKDTQEKPNENSNLVENRMPVIKSIKDYTREELISVIIPKMRKATPVYGRFIDTEDKNKKKEKCEISTVIEDIENNDYQKIYFKPLRLRDISTKTNDIFFTKHDYLGIVVKDKVYMKIGDSYYPFTKEEMFFDFEPIQPLKMYAGQRYVAKGGAFHDGEVIECLKTGYTVPCRSIDAPNKVEFYHNHKATPFYESIFYEQTKEELQKEVVTPISERTFYEMLDREKFLRDALFSPIMRIFISHSNTTSFFDTEKAYRGIVTKDKIFMILDGMFFCFDKCSFLKLFYPCGVDFLEKGKRYFSKINGHFISKGDVVEPVSSGYYVPCKMIERNDRVAFFNAEDLVPFYSVVFSERESWNE